MEIIDEKILAYAQYFSSPEDPVLEQINAETLAGHSHAHMLSGHPQGLFLNFLSVLTRPRRILEIGTFTGYSALALASGLLPGGELHTLELSENEASIAAENFKRIPVGEKIILHRGNALDIIPRLAGDWDLVFIDADKTSYIDYYEMVVPRLTAAGLIIADNVLFHGEVVAEPLKGKNAKAIDAFNRHVQADARTEQVMLTVRDGLLLIRKKQVVL